MMGTRGTPHFPSFCFTVAKIYFLDDPPFESRSVHDDTETLLSPRYQNTDDTVTSLLDTLMSAVVKDT